MRPAHSVRFEESENEMSLLRVWREKRIVAGRWTVKDIIQGRPLGHPSHPMFVHFPSALFPTAVLFDLISLFEPSLALTRAALYNVSVGLLVGVLAALTGLVDYLPMIGGSRKKQVGTDTS